MMIKQVAIYLRKSRDKKEDDDVLSKHRLELTELANSNGWKYTIYEEIASGERLAYRPIIQDMLETVEDGSYDAVLVMDIDRLGRGNNKDWGVIYEAFCNVDHNTLIVTPQRTYDLTVDADEMLVDFQALVAKMEYKAIKRRFKRGKVTGAKQGKWVCGNPPFPYVRNDKTKKLEVNPEKYKIYRMIVDKCITGNTIEEIRMYLNNNKLPMPSGVIPDGKTKGWSQRTILRILKDEIGLGDMIYGRTKGDYRKNNFSKISRDQWTYSEDSHPPVKTPEEHQQIFYQLESRRDVPVAARKRTFVLSGLLYCGACGGRMRFKKGSTGRYFAICNKKFTDGTRCTNRGIGLTDEFHNRIADEAFKPPKERMEFLREQSSEQDEIQLLIEKNKRELSKIDTALEKIFELYEEGSIDKQEFADRKNKRQQQKIDIEQKIFELQFKVKPIKSDHEFVNELRECSDLWLLAETTEDKNKVMHKSLSKIYYTRIDKETIQLRFVYR